MNRPQTILFVAMTFVFLSVSASAEEASQWPEKKTWVMMVGLLEWENPGAHPNMTKRDREDQVLYDTFIKRGVPKEQITFLKDKDATLENIKKEFSTLLKKTKKGDFLITYFSGHGTVNKRGEGFFVNYDAPKRTFKGYWKVSDVFKQIEEEFNGGQILMTADCCFSGTLSEELKKLETKKGYACLASSLCTVESADLWTFTESLVSGFGGRSYIDTDSNGEISLSELKDHCSADMKLFCNQETMFSQNGKFPKTFSLAKASKTEHKDIGKYFEIKVGRKGRWYKAKAAKINDGAIKFSYYPGEFLESVTIKAGSKSIRPIIRKCFSMGDVVDVKYNSRWHPAKILKIDKENFLHLIRYEKHDDWDGWYVFNDLRLRPSPKTQAVEK